MLLGTEAHICFLGEKSHRTEMILPVFVLAVSLRIDSVQQSSLAFLKSSNADDQRAPGSSRRETVPNFQAE